MTSAQSPFQPGRYVIESLRTGDGVILDLQSGNFFQLNRSAVAVCGALLASETTDGAVERLTRDLRISREQAEKLVASTQTLLAQPGIRAPVSSSLEYVQEAEDLCSFGEAGKRLFSIHLRERSLELCAPLDSLQSPLLFYVRAILPKLLALVDVPILHGAACRTRDSFVAFCGLSGAGKTTTALAFREAGATLISEDLLVLSVGDSSVEVYEDGEKLARAWAADAAIQLSRRGRTDFSELTSARHGPRIALRTIWFLEAARRSGERFVLQPLSALEGMLLLLGNGFLATADPIRWREFLRRSVVIAESTTIRALTAPAGLAGLAAAADRYIANWAS
jgi:hypothetical protein